MLVIPVEEVASRAGLVLSPVRSKPGEFYADCPFCNDTAGHLRVNAEKQTYFCFRCGARGGANDFARGLGIPLSAPRPKKMRHPAEALTSEELKALGFLRKPDWGRLWREDPARARALAAWIWREKKSYDRLELWLASVFAAAFMREGIDPALIAGELGDEAVKAAKKRLRREKQERRMRLMDVNHVVLIGRLTKDPQAKATKEGETQVTRFTLAVNRAPAKNGEAQADFIPVVVFGKSAAAVASSLRKGSRVAVDGRIRVQRYKDREGAERVAIEVVASQVQFLDPKKPEDPYAGTFEEEWDPEAECPF